MYSVRFGCIDSASEVDRSPLIWIRAAPSRHLHFRLHAESQIHLKFHLHHPEINICRLTPAPVPDIPRTDQGLGHNHRTGFVFLSAS